MGVVYEAHRPDRDGRYAVKAMHGSLTGDALATGRFLREARTLAEVSHQHVVRIEDSGLEDGRPYIAMEFVEGETLAARLARHSPMAPPQIAALFLPVLSAVVALHERKIVHRDLKPSNVMLRRTPDEAIEPVLLDFGISRLEDGSGGGERDLTRSETLLGTLRYLSPEQLRNARWAGPLSDQYALGVMLYECAAGRRPFGGDSQYDLMHAIVTAPVAPPSASAPQLPLDFDLLTLRAMNRDPARRYASVRALGSALLSFADQATWRRWGAEFTGHNNATAEPGTPDATERDVARPRLDGTVAASGARRTLGRRGRTALAAALAVGGALVALWFGRGPSTPGTPPMATSVTPAPSAMVPAKAHPSLPSPAPSPPASRTEASPPPAPLPVTAPWPVTADPPAARSRRSNRMRKPQAGGETSETHARPTELGDDDVFDPFPRR